MATKLPATTTTTAAVAAAAVTSTTGTPLITTTAVAAAVAPHATSAADDVLALVSAATEPTMHQLLLQVQAQQAQLQQLQQHVAAATGAALGDATHLLGPGPSHAHQQHQPQPDASPHKTDAGLPLTVDTVSANSMDLMPLSAAAVVISSPEHGSHAAARASGQTMRRKSIPLSMKKEAIEWIMGPGKGVPSRAEKHFSALNWDVSASSFRKWWKNRDKIMNDSSSKKRIRGGGRKPYLEESEEKLLVIVIQERAKKDRVTRKWIAKTAQHMFQRTNANFKASENWVTKFIRRNGLTLKRSYVTYEHGNDDGSGVAAAMAEGMGDHHHHHHHHHHMGLGHGAIEVHDDDGDEDSEDEDTAAGHLDGVKDAPPTVLV